MPTNGRPISRWPPTSSIRWWPRAAYRAEIEATQQLIELQNEQVGIAKVQAEAGTVPYANVLSLQSQLASYEATIPQLEQKLDQSEDLLAALAGHPAGRVAGAPGESGGSDSSRRAAGQPALRFGAPASRHPGGRSDRARGQRQHRGRDGRAAAQCHAERQLRALDRIRPPACSRRTEGPGASGAAATAPLFEGGTLWFKRKAAINQYDQAMALYRQTVLGAFEQVADVLHALDHDAAALSAQDQALAAAAEALHLVQIDYDAGIATYLDVLLADTQFHQAKIADLQAVAVRYQDTVALFAALGGGWWNAP